MDIRLIAIMAGALLLAACAEPSGPQPPPYELSWRPAPAVIGGYGEGWGVMYGPALSTDGRYGDK